MIQDASERVIHKRDYSEVRILRQELDLMCTNLVHNELVDRIDAPCHRRACSGD
jgi:hypothetical protein